MTYAVKVYVVSDAERVIDVKLTFEAARAVAKLDGGRKIERFEANKLLTPTQADPIGGQRGDSRIKPSDPPQVCVERRPMSGAKRRTA